MLLQSLYAQNTAESVIKHKKVFFRLVVLECVQLIPSSKVNGTRHKTFNCFPVNPEIQWVVTDIIPEDNVS